MPPKAKFNKETIVAAAFEIAKEKGFSGVTARSVAESLGSSVAPIYVNFETIEGLIEAVVQRVFALTEELMAKQAGPDPFANIGNASLAFAREYPVLFRELTMQPNQYMDSYETVETALIEVMAEDEVMRDWTAEERKRLLLKMRVFQLGLSAMIANGHVPDWLDEQAAEELLMEAGDDLLRMQQLKKEENNN